MPTNSFVWGIEKIDSRPPNSSLGTHAPEQDCLRSVQRTQSRQRGRRWHCCYSSELGAALQGLQGLTRLYAHCGCFAISLFFLPSHSPSDMGLPRSTLRRALVRVCACRQIHLYGKSKKSTHGHQTHLPARTHQRHFVSGLFPPPRPPRPAGRESLG